jgi:hypothetical protein
MVLEMLNSHLLNDGLLQNLLWISVLFLARLLHYAANGETTTIGCLPLGISWIARPVFGMSLAMRMSQKGLTNFLQFPISFLKKGRYSYTQVGKTNVPAGMLLSVSRQVRAP